MYLDKEKVEVGDKVYDIKFGGGEVTDISESLNAFTVQFSDPSAQLIFKPDGRLNNAKRRTLYWHNPIVVIPTKGEKSWHALRSLCVSAAQTVRGLSQRS